MKIAPCRNTVLRRKKSFHSDDVPNRLVCASYSLCAVFKIF